MSSRVYVAVVVALYRAITMLCLHDVSMIAIGAAGAAQEQEEPSLHHVAPECPYLMNRHKYTVLILMRGGSSAVRARYCVGARCTYRSLRPIPAHTPSVNIRNFTATYNQR